MFQGLTDEQVVERLDEMDERARKHARAIQTLADRLRRALDDQKEIAQALRKLLDSKETATDDSIGMTTEYDTS